MPKFKVLWKNDYIVILAAKDFKEAQEHFDAFYPANEQPGPVEVMKYEEAGPF